MEYITDSIGEEYKEWKAGERIFISSPTGSGKTTFILKTLLPFLAQREQKMLYLVNRTALKEQIEEEITRIPYQLRAYIEVVLYQTIENKLFQFKVDGSVLQYDNNLVREYLNYDCVVCDEAHYFLMDSNYNTKTILSYNFIMQYFSRKIRIYISATIDKIESFIEADCTKNFCSYWLGYSVKEIPKQTLFYNDNMGKKNYELQRDYSNIEINVLKDRNAIKELVVNDEGKWLIFVDSKAFGRELAKKIKNAFKDKDKENLSGKAVKDKNVVFVTSDYNEDEDAEEVVEVIVQDGKQSPKVLITTSVLDNGISIKDIALRNVVIVADTETEFIQMLGRKRYDGTSIKLYIYKHDRNHFVKRNRINSRRLALVDSYCTPIEKQLKENVKKISNCGMDKGDYLNKVEAYYINIQHQIMMSKLWNQNIYYEDIRSVFLPWSGCFVLNRLSFYNLKQLDTYYVELLEKFDKYGDDAFVREQLEWLGKSNDEIDKIISDSNKTSYQNSRERVIKELEKISIKQQINKKDYAEITQKMRKDLLELLEYAGKECEGYSTHKGQVVKNGTVITTKFMKFLSENCDIPFVVERGSENETYIIIRKTE